MEFHEAAAIFPLLDPEDFEIFKQDIKERGLEDPILTYRGKIIDGRNRFNACRELGIQPVYTEWDGEGSLTELLASLNLHRRHLSTNQRAMVGAKMRDSLRAEAQQRSFANLGSKTAFSEEFPDSLKSSGQGKTSEIAGRLVKTSSFNVERAGVVVDRGSPELLVAVQSDQVAIDNAATLAALPHDEQRAIVAKGPEAMLEKAKELRAERQTKPAREQKPLAERGAAGMKKYMDSWVDEAAKRKQPLSPEEYFNRVKAAREAMVGR